MITIVTHDEEDNVSEDIRKNIEGVDCGDETLEEAKLKGNILMEIQDRLDQDPLEQYTENVIELDKIILAYLSTVFSDMSAVGIRDMYFAAKYFVHDKSDLVGEELSKATSLIMIELLDYTRDMINMKEDE